MKKKMIYLMSALVLAFCLAFSVRGVSYAYTEEEKQQAKAWLSAHGYSPDAGGASQAYQDYLNGKFDEELGYDTNGDGIPAATTEESSQQESSTENKTDATSAKTEEKTDSTETSDNNGSNGSPSVKKEVSNVKNSQMEPNDNEDPAKDSLEEQEKIGKEQQQQSTENTDSSQDAAKEMGITWYRTENKIKYQNAGIVVVISGLFILLWGAFFHS
ncbi:MAG: hypothetical protein K2K56_03135 [Lachnospiraceae bacterium]|nr:hypothetical protein [Lachnospiraceae bacterium]